MTTIERLLATAPHTKLETLEISRCQNDDEVLVLVERFERERLHISGAVYPAIETAYGRTVDHGFNVRIF